MQVKLPLALLLAAALAVPGAAAPKPEQSWGKAGVSFEDYRTDALECGRRAHYADVSQTEHAKAFVEATRQLETIDGYSSSGNAETDMDRAMQLAAQAERVRSALRPEQRMRELKAALVAIVETCLRERGYTRFELTEEQRGALGKLKAGSDDRHRFMHSLASDPQVLRAQAVARG